MLKFVEKIDFSLVQKMCIKNNWCTKMSNETFESLFSNIKTANREADRVSEAAIIAVAKMIYAFSETDDDTDAGHIACLIFQTCMVRWVEEEN